MYIKHIGTNQIIKKTTPEAANLGKLIFKLQKHDGEFVEFSVTELTLLFALDSCLKNPCQDHEQKETIKNFWSDYVSKYKNDELKCQKQYKRYFKAKVEVNEDLSKMIDGISSKLDLSQYSPTYIFEYLCYSVSLQQGITQEQLDEITSHIYYYFAEKHVTEDFFIVDTLTNEKGFTQKYKDLLFNLITKEYREVKQLDVQNRIARTFIDKMMEESPTAEIKKLVSTELPFETSSSLSQSSDKQLLDKYYPKALEAVSTELLPEYIPIITELTKAKEDDKGLTRAVTISQLQSSGIEVLSKDETQDKIQIKLKEGQPFLSIDIKEIIELEKKTIGVLVESIITSLKNELKRSKDYSIKGDEESLSLRGISNRKVRNNIMLKLKFAVNARKASETLDFTHKTDQSNHNACVDHSMLSGKEQDCVLTELGKIFPCDDAAKGTEGISKALSQEYQQMYGEALNIKQVDQLIQPLMYKDKSKNGKPEATSDEIKEQYHKISTTARTATEVILKKDISQAPNFILQKLINQPKYNEYNTTYNDAYNDASRSSSPVKELTSKSSTAKQQLTGKELVEHIILKNETIEIKILEVNHTPQHIRQDEASTEQQVQQQCNAILIHKLSAKRIDRIVATFINQLTNSCCTRTKSLREDLDHQFESVIKNYLDKLKVLGLTQESISEIIRNEELYKIYLECNTSEDRKSIKTLLSTYISNIPLLDEHGKVKSCTENCERRSCVEQFIPKIQEELQKKIGKTRANAEFDSQDSETKQAVQSISEIAYIYCNIENVLQQTQQVKQQALTKGKELLLKEKKPENKQQDNQIQLEKPAPSISNAAITSVSRRGQGSDNVRQLLYGNM